MTEQRLGTDRLSYSSMRRLADTAKQSLDGYREAGNVYLKWQDHGRMVFRPRPGLSRPTSPPGLVVYHQIDTAIEQRSHRTY